MIRALTHKICSDKFKFIIAPLIVGIASSGLIFQNLYFFSTLQSQNQMLCRTLSFMLYIMCFISFYQSIKISNDPPLNLIKPRLKKLLRNNHPAYTQTNQCFKQNNKYKAPRTSHCSSCKCIVRMDHHCPYINNCVGLKNLKAFILFTGYGGLFALEFLIFSIVHYFDLKNQKISPMSEGQITIWLFLTFVSFLLALSMCGLAISNIVMASKNITQLEMLKGTFRFSDKHGLHPNPYDLGYFTNLNLIFDSDKWGFWIPTEIVTYNDGTQFKLIPEITEDEIKHLPNHIKQDIKTNIQKLIPRTIQQLREKELQNYRDTIFFYLGKEYRLFSDENKENGSSLAQKEEFNKSNEIKQGYLSKQQEAQKYEKQLERQAEQQLLQIQTDQQMIREQGDGNSAQNLISLTENKNQDEQQDQYRKVISDIYGDEANQQNPNNANSLESSENSSEQQNQNKQAKQKQNKEDQFEEISSQEN